MHTALQTWILFRQATLCGDPSLLEGAKQLLEASLVSKPQQARPAQHLLDDDDSAEDDAEISGREFAEDIGEAIADWVCARLSDYVREMPGGGGHLASIGEVLAVLHGSMGQMDALPDVSAPQSHI